VDAERHRFWLDGLGHVLKGDACESTEDGCGRASATGWRGSCCEQVRWVEAGSCMELRSPQRRSLVARGSSRATTMIKAAFPVVNAATPTQLCRDLVPQAGSRSQLEAGELFASTWGGRFSPAPAASVERTPTTIHIARRQMRRWPGQLLFSSELLSGRRWPPEPVTP
jgi:hypothetical protein